MRYFIARSGNDVVGKRVAEGDDTAIDEQLTQYKDNHPEQTVSEVDKDTFEATLMATKPTPAQVAWAAFKATGPTAPQAIGYLAKHLGLE